MKPGDFQAQLTATNTWWSRPDWEQHDPDLSRVIRSPFDYEPGPLADIRPDGLYMLRGPRRVGKSVEVKRTISRLISAGVAPRMIIHYACNGLSRTEIQSLVRAAQGLTPRSDAPRYWFLDEITAAKTDWPDAIAHLRDNNPQFRNDCVVLTGSSSRNLDAAVKALADRRGQVSKADRVLLPMSFRAFCGAVQPDRTFPDPEPMQPRDFNGVDWHGAVYELVPLLDELIMLWELYLRIGGYPRAVRDHLEAGSVSQSFLEGLWNVVYGDALRSGRYDKAQIRRMLGELSTRLTAPVNLTQLAEDCGFADHSVASDRIFDLTAAYLIWPCFQSGPQGLPNVKAQRKVYFIDPLLARLAHLLDAAYPEPVPEVVSEQQLGLALLRALASESSDAVGDYSALLYTKTPTNKEIDFVGPQFNEVAFESKYIDEKKTQATATLKARSELSGIMASRSLLDLDASVPWVPTALLAWLLHQPTTVRAA